MRRLIDKWRAAFIFGDFMFTQGFVAVAVFGRFIDNPLAFIGVIFALWVWASWWSGYAAGERERKRGQKP